MTTFPLLALKILHYLKQEEQIPHLKLCKTRRETLSTKKIESYLRCIKKISCHPPIRKVQIQSQTTHSMILFISWSQWMLPPTKLLGLRLCAISQIMLLANGLHKMNSCPLGPVVS
jgi:hypothetical protein